MTGNRKRKRPKKKTTKKRKKEPRGCQVFTDDRTSLWVCEAQFRLRPKP